MRSVLVNNQSRPLSEPLRINVCETFFSRLLGFMFHPPISKEQGLLFIQDSESRMDAAIHMFFVNFDLAVIWIDRQGGVVDTCLARRWRPFYMPARKAKMILEVHPCHLTEFTPGDGVSIQHV